MSAEENRTLHRRYIEEMNNGNFAFLNEYMAPGYVFHGAGIELEGVDAFKSYVQSMLVAFSELERMLEDTIAERDRVVSRWTGRAVHSGEFAGIPPTGKRVTITGIIISRIENGQAVEEWEEIDRLGLLQQLGA